LKSQQNVLASLWSGVDKKLVPESYAFVFGLRLGNFFLRYPEQIFSGIQRAFVICQIICVPVTIMLVVNNTFIPLPKFCNPRVLK
tara:strand:+ start:653 stop:907 length:255 start_codon:yes stop_codon:yes gene_type:complete